MSYSIDDYTDAGILKPGLFMTLLIAVSSRFLLYGPLSLLARRGGIRGGNNYVDVSVLDVDSPFLMIASVPPVVILYILIARSARTGDFLRKIWKNGRVILVVSVVCQLALELGQIVSAGEAGLPAVAGLILTGYTVLYFGTSRRARDVFESFPAKPINSDDSSQ